MQFTLALLALASAAFAAPGPAITGVAEREIGGGAAGTLGPLQGTLGGALGGPTGAVEGCIGGAIGPLGYTDCFPVATPPPSTNTQHNDAAGNLRGTLGPASGFLDSNGLCGGLAVGNDGFTTCLLPTAKPKASA